jgi:hypothetical protein
MGATAMARHAHAAAEQCGVHKQDVSSEKRKACTKRCAHLTVMCERMHNRRWSVSNEAGECSAARPVTQSSTRTVLTRERGEYRRCFRLVSGATRKAVWLADGKVAKSDIARTSTHRWEGGTSEVALKVGVQHLHSKAAFEGRERGGACIDIWVGGDARVCVCERLCVCVCVCVYVYVCVCV